MAPTARRVKKGIFILPALRLLKAFRLAALACTIFASTVTFGAAATSAKAVGSLMPRVDKFVEAEMRRQKVPGLALGIVSGNVVIAAKGYGYANVELSVPVTQDTVFQSGSVGKSFTAIAVMLQVEDGKLALDDRLSKYFPGAPASWQPITVRDLLNHTSGIPDWAEPDAHPQLDGKPAIDFRRDYSEEELTKIASRLPLEFQAGSRFHYSNTGYVVLGVLVHRVSGRFYGDVLMDRVFKPLGMRTARVINEADIIKNRAAGYRLVDGKLKNQEWVAPTWNTTADGSLYLSIRDYIAWDHGLRTGAILKPTSWTEVYTPGPQDDQGRHPYGFGWAIRSWHGKPWYYNSGGWQGFSACISRYLADDLTIVVLTNLAEGSPQGIIDGIASLVDPELPKLEAKRASSP